MNFGLNRLGFGYDSLKFMHNVRLAKEINPADELFDCV